MRSLDDARALISELRRARRELGVYDEMDLTVMRRRLDRLAKALDSHSQRLDLLEQRIAGSGHDRIVGAP